MAVKQRCPICRRAFAPRRCDARFCRAACRQRAYRLRKRVWYADATGNVWVDGEWAGRVSSPGGKGWEMTGLEVTSLADLLPDHDVAAEPPRGRDPAIRILRRAAEQMNQIAAERLESGTRGVADLCEAARELRRRARRIELREMALSDARRAEVAARLTRPSA